VFAIVDPRPQIRGVQATVVGAEAAGVCACR
jgi:hypothetical protein